MSDNKISPEENDELATANPAHGADLDTEEALNVVEEEKKEEDNA